MNTLRHLRFLLLSLMFTSGALAASGPEFKALRAHSMGNAFVALVDDKDALYYNPAGLNLINALGNKGARPGLANYPRNRLNARANLIGATLPVQDMLDLLRFYRRNGDALSNADSARANPAWMNELTPFDRRPIEVGTMVGAEFAMHNLGVALWGDQSAAPYGDEGLLIPGAGISLIQLDVAMQVAGARGFLNNRLAVGAGYTLANRQTVRDFSVDPVEIADEGTDALIDRVVDTLQEKASNLSDPATYGHGIDLGALWQQTSWLRLGGSIRNVGMYLDHELVTPELTVGAVFTPPVLSTGGMFARKVNLAMDFEDLFNNERNYKFLSKVNFGAEVEQQLWWVAALRVASGFKGGYASWGAGISLVTAVHIEYASWAEEGGYYTGAVEDRFHAFRIGVGL